MRGQGHILLSSHGPRRTPGTPSGLSGALRLLKGSDTFCQAGFQTH